MEVLHWKAIMRSISRVTNWLGELGSPGQLHGSNKNSYPRGPRWVEEMPKIQGEKGEFRFVGCLLGLAQGLSSI